VTGAWTEDRARPLVIARSGDRCEIDREPGTDLAHRVDRSDGGTWAPSNLLRLCRKCHAWTHAEPLLAVEGGWRLRSTDDPATSPAWLWTPYGQAWFVLSDLGDYVFSARPPVLPPWVEVSP